MLKKGNKGRKQNKFVTLGRILCALILMGTLSGCTDEIPEMTEEQTRMVEEYAAQLILKYDRNHTSSILTDEERAIRLAKLEQLAELQIRVQEEKERAEQANQNQEVDDNTDSSGEIGENSSEDAVIVPAYFDIDETLGLNGIEISYKDYIVTNTYPMDLEVNDWQGVVMASSSNTLLVFEFQIENQSGEEQSLELYNIDKRFAFKINQNITKTVLTTYLVNDLSNYNQNIAPGEIQTAVLLIEVSPDIVDEISSLSMVMRYNGERYELNLQ